MRKTFKNTIAVRAFSPGDIDFIYNGLKSLAEEENISDRFVMTKDDLFDRLFGRLILAEVLIAEIDGEKSGLLLFSETNRNFILFEKPGIYMHDLYVNPKHRNKGIGRKMIGELISIAKTRNLGRIDWVVLNDNEKGKMFYDKLNEAKIVDNIQYMRMLM